MAQTGPRSKLVRVSSPTYEWLRTRAYETRLPITQVIDRLVSGVWGLQERRLDQRRRPAEHRAEAADNRFDRDEVPL